MLTIGKMDFIQAQWQVIYPPFPDSQNFIAWGISIVDENIVWGNPIVNTPPETFPPVYLTSKYYYKTVDGYTTSLARPARRIGGLPGYLEGAGVLRETSGFQFTILCKSSDRRTVEIPGKP
jgi:hypothetical protein